MDILHTWILQSKFYIPNLWSVAKLYICLIVYFVIKKMQIFIQTVIDKHQHET